MNELTFFPDQRLTKEALYKCYFYNTLELVEHLSKRRVYVYRRAIRRKYWRARKTPFING